MKVDADEKIRYVLHNPDGKSQMHRKPFEESLGVVTEKLRKTVEKKRIVKQQTQEACRRS